MRQDSATKWKQYPQKNDLVVKTEPKIKLDGCIVWNALNTVLGSKRLAVCATV